MEIGESVIADFSGLEKFYQKNIAQRKKEPFLAVLVVFVIVLMTGYSFHDYLKESNGRKVLYSWTSTVSPANIQYAAVHRYNFYGMKTVALSPEQIEKVTSLIRQVPLQNLTVQKPNRKHNYDKDKYTVQLYLYTVDERDFMLIYDGDRFILLKEYSEQYGGRSWRMKDEQLEMFFSELLSNKRNIFTEQT